MTRAAKLFGLAVSACLASTMASAQLTAPPASADPTATAPAETAPRAKPRRPASPRPATAVTVINASANTATEVVITGEDKSAMVSKPLGPKARTAVRLPKLKGCVVSVAATFEGEGQVEAGEFNVCKDKTIRFTD